jgi:hypothetical protein
MYRNIEHLDQVNVYENLLKYTNHNHIFQIH